MMINSTGVYKITNTISGDFYIGSARISFHKRWSKHKWQLRTNKHPNKHMQNSWNKYGETAFNFSILEICPKELCLSLVKGMQFIYVLP